MLNENTRAETLAEIRHVIAKIFSPVGRVEFRYVISREDMQIMIKSNFMTFATKRNKTKVASLTSTHHNHHHNQHHHFSIKSLESNGA